MDLKNHVDSIAASPPQDPEDFLDIEYIVNAEAEYLGARVLVAFGGPNIWINTRTNKVEGYWWETSYSAPYDDDDRLDDLCREYWGCR